MIPFIAFAVNHLWQSTVFAAVAGLLTLALRRNSAQTRYWLWLAASLKFLLPAAALIALGHQVEWRTSPSLSAEVAVIAPAGEAQPASIPPRFPAQRISDPQTMTLPAAIFAIWLCGFAFVMDRWRRKWMRLRAIVRTAKPIALPGGIEARSTEALLEPGVLGIFRPVLLLPAGIGDRLTPAQFSAVVAHELCHVRRRDNLAAAIHMLVEAIFWFHPLVWWLESRLIAERERACDEEVLRMGAAPQEYAAGILQVCRLYLESPMVCAAGVTGADLKQRVADIMTSRAVRGLTRLQKTALAAVACMAIAGPLVVGIWNAPPIHAQGAERPAFQVASIKPSKDTPPFRIGMLFQPSGRLEAHNPTARQLVEVAYDVPTFKHYTTGGESWVDNERFNIEAKAEDGVISPKMSDEARNKAFRLMLQSMLAERFHLVVHAQSKEMPVYALLVDKGGPKLTKAPERDCSGDFACHGFKGGRARGVAGQSVNMEDLAEIVGVFSDRPVQDHTGIKGDFDITLPGWSDPTRPPSPGVLEGREAGPDPNAPDIFGVLKQTLGLKLEARKATVQTYMIERLDRPSEN